MGFLGGLPGFLGGFRRPPGGVRPRPGLLLAAAPDEPLGAFTAGPAPAACDPTAWDWAVRTTVDALACPVASVTLAVTGVRPLGAGATVRAVPAAAAKVKLPSAAVTARATW